MDADYVAEKMGLYDKYVELAQGILSLWENPCGIQGEYCLRGKPTCCVWKPGCKQFDAAVGCTEKNLLCAFFFCDTAEKANPLLAEIMRCLEHKARRDLPHLAFYISRHVYERILTDMKEIPNEGAIA